MTDKIKLIRHRKISGTTWGAIGVGAMLLIYFGIIIDGVYKTEQNKKNQEIRQKIEAKVSEFANDLPGYRTYISDSTNLANHIQMWELSGPAIADTDDARARIAQNLESLRNMQDSMMRIQSENYKAISRYRKILESQQGK